MPLQPGNRHLLIVLGLRSVTGNQMALMLDEYRLSVVDQF